VAGAAGGGRGILSGLRIRATRRIAAAVALLALAGAACDGSERAAEPPGAPAPELPVTDVTVDDRVQVRDVKRLGLNLGAHDRYGAEKLRQNLLPNPGFEPGGMATVWLADAGSTDGAFRVAHWDVRSGAHPPGFWDGAEYEIPLGPAAGARGRVRAFRHEDGRYVFDLGGGETPLREGDVLFTRRALPGARGMHGDAGTADPEDAFAGAQSLRLEPGEHFDFVQDTAWRDGDPGSHKLLLVEGRWTVRLAARGARGTERIRVLLRRDGPAPWNPVFLDRSFPVETDWRTLEETRLVPPGADQTPRPWPAPYRPALVFRVEVPDANEGPVWIDELRLFRADASTDPSGFDDRLVRRLREYRPGVLRWWSGQLGETLDNLTRPGPERRTSGWSPRRASAERWSLGAHAFLSLCARVGADPWLVLPPTATRDDLHGFLEYLAGTSGPHAGRRRAQGRAAPWTRAFDRIHLEYGNELWTPPAPDGVFAGAAVGDGETLAALADRAFAFLREHPLYEANAEVLRLVIGGRASRPALQAEIERGASRHDAVALGPYFGRLERWRTPAERYGPLFAAPFHDGLHPLGRVGRSRRILAERGTPLSIYEISYHTTSTETDVPTPLRNRFVAGASGALALPLHMLVYLTELGVRAQCAFKALGFAYRFDPSGGLPGRPEQYVRLWGMLRDLTHLELARPTWLGVVLANRAIRGDAVTTRHAGDDPGWVQEPMNGMEAPTPVRFVQSFAFREGDRYGLVLFNLSLDRPQGIRLKLPGAPRPEATVHAIEPAHIEDTNELRENVTLETRALSDFRDGYAMTLPPHSVRAVLWRAASR